MALACRVLVFMCASCTALQLQSMPRVPLCQARSSAPAMQFFGKKKEPEPVEKAPPKRKGGFFYDDEIDTVTQEPWQPTYAENGEVDLAAVGGVFTLLLSPSCFFSSRTRQVYLASAMRKATSELPNLTVTRIIASVSTAV
eukprot:CAMPEP_0183348840 /NCGR_PEP_ID=MMETSP0164_2-20130417/13220_1 /TAXON_ID=221442 /ORGANISM="Coccolithus pelagicus ssp braarudi, Strain PLY182g" /LENGTH=140 /DNA_ID=CAMNT_0025520487 /DNA_START=91 /DNA_END=514 /DNA_ORIENTATION=+